MEAPQSLVHHNQLCNHDIYRIGKLCVRELDLITGRNGDDLEVTCTNPWDGNGVMPSCERSLANGSTLGACGEQYQTLKRWHAGLSCQLTLKPSQGSLVGGKSAGFLAEFNDRARPQNTCTELGKFRTFQVYELPRGTWIPDNIGIEMDGDNHVCLFPTDRLNTVSNIEPGSVAFTIDALVQLQPFWRPYAIFQVQGAGFNWPECIPPDSKFFPFRQWLSAVVESAEACTAYYASCAVIELIAGELPVWEFLRKMISISEDFLLDCPENYFDMSVVIKKALTFALDFHAFHVDSTNGRAGTIMLKAAHRSGDESYERAIVCDRCTRLEDSCRVNLFLGDGRCSIAAAGSVVVLFIGVTVLTSPSALILPFAVVMNGTEVVFDFAEPFPVIKEEEGSAACAVVEASLYRSVEGGELVVVSASARTAVSVLLTVEEKGEILALCLRCFGYTDKGLRCRNKRKPRASEQVWCYQHLQQEEEWMRFQAFGERPVSCDWWEDVAGR